MGSLLDCGRLVKHYGLQERRTGEMTTAVVKNILSSLVFAF